MLQHQIAQSPARLGLTNPNSPSIQNPIPKLPPSQQQSHLQNQYSNLSSTTSSTLLPLLPPLPRAQSLLIQMASLASKLFEVSPNRALWLTSFRGSFPSFLTSQTHPSPSTSLDSSPSTAKEILSLFTVLQTQLFEAVAELQEILNLQDAKQKISSEIRAKDASLLAFANKLKDTEQILDVLVDDYSDYRRPKRSKTEEEEEEEEDSSDITSATTVSYRLKLSHILSYAHRISYTTFAPPEFGAGQAPLRGALPPAPQEEQMRASQLYNFADLDVGLPKTTESKDKIVEAMVEPPPGPQALEVNPLANLAGFFPRNITVPSGWKPGMPVELPKDITMPLPGWKTGDPLPPLDSLPVGPRVDEERLRPMAVHRASEPIQVQHVQLDILDQDDDSSDYSSDDGSSEED